ncbi:MAG: bifunctional demethylmenaquinone methyltransferase/2-methoxy-6-polyprenyl-1,4-benzoquinol methylase UbiE [Alistipes sp.]|nr:bifunctional demethylmenaquinone methyltransferase/2-methoxy-6-polyprenyl-1,4-benzoquinol methylase UbiE [Alistipes sp.]
MTVKPYNTGSTKKEEVRGMFDNIAPSYDFLNHALSFNIDRRWRRQAVEEVRRGAPRRILDMATGTGDLAIELARRMGDAHITGVDLSEKMLDVARRKVEARGLSDRIALRQGDAEHPAEEGACFDAATVAFGVRNFGDLHAGLCGLARAIKPGGKVVILEFSRPRNRLFRALFGFYFGKVLPWVGGMVSHDRQAYAYLPASVGEFPSPEAFVAMMGRAGFRECRARSLSGGIAHIYIGEMIAKTF